MFWGLIMEPNKRYSQVVERSFHLSMASLDVTGANDQPVQVMLCYDNRNYLLCTLKKGSIFQVPLDLNFQEGTKIAFTCNGFGHVHLTGYLTLDEELDFGDMEEEEEDEEEEEEEEAPQLVKPKRKAVETLKKVSKKLKKEESNDDEDSSVAETDTDEENVTASMEAEDDEDDSDDDDDDEEEEDEDDSDDESEPEVAKSKQKQKQAQQAQNQLVKKQEKQKMVNGKDVKQDSNKQQKKKKPENEQQNSQQQNSQQPKRRTIEGGVVVEDLVLGNGAPAKPGRGVTVYYVGRLKNGKKFDETRQGDGFKFQLGKGEVIKGWDVGIAGMKIGGKRRLTIPAPMGYGNKGSPPVIPGNSTLIFDVELKKVH